MPPFRINDHDRFNKIAGGIQSLVIAVAVIVGGGWTLYTFGSLDTVAKARADVEKVRAELSQIQPVLETSIVQETRVCPFAHCLNLSVTIQNKGVRNTEIRWSRAAPLTIKPLADLRGLLSGSPDPIFPKPVSVGIDPPKAYLLLSGGRVRLPFLVKVQNAGLYYVEFQTEATVSDIRGNSSKVVSAGDKDPAVWSDAIIAVVN